MSNLLTESEVAAYLNMSARTLRRARNSGRLPFVHLGRLVRYRQADVDAFVQRSIVINDNDTATSPPAKRVAARVRSARPVSFTELDKRR